MKQSFECANMEIDNSYISAIAFTKAMDYNATINLKAVMGEMYDKYDYFIIYYNSFGCWNAVTSYTAGAAVGLNATAMWTLGMKGLNWMNSTYNGISNEIAYFPDRFTLPINGYGGYNSSIQSGIVFRKPDNPFVNINIVPYLVRTGASCNAVNTGNGGYDINYSFSIYGLYEDEHKKKYN